MKRRHLTALAIVLTMLGFAPAVHASECGGPSYFPGREDYLDPNSIALPDLQGFLDTTEWAEGVRLSVELRGSDLWVDVIEFPGTVTLAAAQRIVFIIGRLTDGGFDRMIFAEDDTGVFLIGEPALKRIGCGFIWGYEGGQNPIALMREFYDNLRHYTSGQRVAAPYTGSLLGDTQAALDANNLVFAPRWVLSAVIE